MILPDVNVLLHAFRSDSSDHERCRAWLSGVVNGDCDPFDLIPRLVEMHRKGEFPIEKLVRFYRLDQINEAVADSASGATIKPIIRF